MRNKFNPYMVTNVIAGFQDGKRFLGHVDMYGAKMETDHIVTGMASIIFHY
jgi:20S proteasome subunit beta 7